MRRTRALDGYEPRGVLFADLLRAVKQMIDEGVVKYVGLCNASVEHGTTQFVHSCLRMRGVMQSAVASCSDGRARDPGGVAGFSAEQPKLLGAAAGEAAHQISGGEK